MRFAFPCNHATCHCRTGSARDAAAATVAPLEDAAPQDQLDALANAEQDVPAEEEDVDEDAMAEEPDEFDSSDGISEQWPSGCDPAWLSDAAPPFETEERKGYKEMPSPLWDFRFKVTMNPTGVNNAHRLVLRG